MIKQKKFNLAETNIANLGTDLEKKVRATAAHGEDQWKDAGKKVGLEVWRIVNFTVTDWPVKQYGEFYDGDSYIILHTYKKTPASQSLSWDLYFWLGKRTTQDEAGTAAYKTVELDDNLGGAPIEHREVQEHESAEFLKLFEGKIRYLSGGADTGFHHVGPEKYRPRLLQIRGRANNKNDVAAKERPLSRDSLNKGDVFILDTGLIIYQWAGSSAGIFEKNKASQIARAFDDERRGQVKIVVINGEANDEDSAEFWKALGGHGPVKSASEGDKEASATTAGSGPKKLFRVHDNNFNEVPVKKASLASDDVFILDAACEIFVWVGKGSSKQERSTSLGRAQDYLAKSGRPLYLPLTRIYEGGENEIFLHHLTQ
jgi:gelsolin